MATGSPLEGWKRATRLDWPIRFLTESSIARTIGTDMLTNDPSSSRSELKWSVWRNSFSLMNPRSGLAHPSLSTWTHCRSTCDSWILGNPITSFCICRLTGSSTTRDTSFPPSGAISCAEAARMGNELGFWCWNDRFNDGMNWVLVGFAKLGVGVGVFVIKDAIFSWSYGFFCQASMVLLWQRFPRPYIYFNRLYLWSNNNTINLSTKNSRKVKQKRTTKLL